jgi:phosphate-selective porin OprO/OprP
MLLMCTLQASAQRTGREPQAPAIDDTIEAGEANVEAPARRLIRWNEYEGPLFTVRVGGGFLYEYAAFAQDKNSKEQFALEPKPKVRDARILLKGRLKFSRPVTWSSGIMYDGPTNTWLIRETGVMVEVPEISGHLFFGRTKEGFSLNKVMVGYAGWTMERATINDATIPILADGVKWLGYVPKFRVLWNLGVYGDWLSEGQSFSTYDRQIVGRLAWLPLLSPSTGSLLHVGLSIRNGKPNGGKLRLRSRPEAFPAPYFIDTGEFAAKSSDMTGFEVYYRPGSLLVGSEYFLEHIDAPASGNPFFHGGDFAVSWLPTGEIRAYNTRGGFFNQISPARPVFEGGPGAWELVGRFSYIDLDGGTLRGGKFWRFTPSVNWHLSDHVRLAMTYGYGSLERLNLRGKTHFFQTRIQLQLRNPKPAGSANIPFKCGRPRGVNFPLSRLNLYLESSATDNPVAREVRALLLDAHPVRIPGEGERDSGVKPNNVPG